MLVSEQAGDSSELLVEHCSVPAAEHTNAQGVWWVRVLTGYM